MLLVMQHLRDLEPDKLVFAVDMTLPSRLSSLTRHFNNGHHIILTQIEQFSQSLQQKPAGAYINVEKLRIKRVVSSNKPFTEDLLP